MRTVNTPIICQDTKLVGFGCPQLYSRIAHPTFIQFPGAALQPCSPAGLLCLQWFHCLKTPYSLCILSCHLPLAHSLHDWMLHCWCQQLWRGACQCRLCSCLDKFNLRTTYMLWQWVDGWCISTNALWMSTCWALKACPITLSFNLANISTCSFWKEGCLIHLVKIICPVLLPL